jgi:hypothetical protein
MAILYAENVAHAVGAGANQAVTLTKPADPTKETFLFGLTAAFNQTGTALFTISIGGVIRYRRVVQSAYDLDLSAPWRLPANTAVVFTLAAATGAVGAISAWYTDVGA